MWQKVCYNDAANMFNKIKCLPYICDNLAFVLHVSINRRATGQGFYSRIRLELASLQVYKMQIIIASILFCVYIYSAAYTEQRRV